mgnify:FL=1
MRLSIKSKLLLSHFLAIVLVSGSVGTYFYYTAVDNLLESLKARLMYSAALLSRALDARSLESIRSKKDIALPVYQEGLRTLREFLGTNRDIAFLYIMRRTERGVEFVVDSDSTAKQAMPGQLYEADAKNLPRGFTAFSVDDQIVKDQWGYFLSGYAPLKNGNGRYLVGIDMRADEVQAKFHAIRVSGVVSLLISLCLAWFFSFFLARRITHPVLSMALRAGEIAEGHLVGQVESHSRDELADLAGAFNRMSSHLAKSREETRVTLEALRQARDNLERRVAERTAELETVNRELRHENAERLRAEEALKAAATTDYLTGLCNRPALLHLIENEDERLRRSGGSYALILADVDRFKEVNDRYGHESGDIVLQKLAGILREHVRAQDTVARWGGDEIMIFLPDTGLPGALEVARKLLEQVSSRPIDARGTEHHLTLSMGTAVSRPGMSVKECTHRADLALYEAKAAGRNRVMPAPAE